MKNKIMKNALTRIFTTVKIEPKINDEVEIKEKVVTRELLNMIPKSYLILLTENSYWALSTKLGTRLLRLEKIASRKVSSLAS